MKTTGKIFVLALVALMLMTAALPAMTTAEGAIMYVATDNKGYLNVRSDPMVANNVIGHLNYATAVSVRMTTSNGWACIDYPAAVGGVAYVQTRFLSWTKPGSVTPPPSDPGTGLAGINAEFRSARQVPYPFTVVARPSRASGWVNLRWAPSTEAERITTCSQGKELTVLMELNNWYQVQDPMTGMIGYISKNFVTIK